MKRYLLFLLLTIASMISAKALSYNEARERAWYLTDKVLKISMATIGTIGMKISDTYSMIGNINHI